MRFSAVHKTTSYLMVGCGYGALVFSGELNLIGVVLGALLIGLSWFFEPPRFRPERWTVWWNALAVAAFGYTLLSAFVGGEVVVSGAHLIIFLLVAKMYNRRSSRDYQMVYVLSFLMLVAGTALNADLSYAVFFLGYVVFATWALILFHLRREMEDNFLLKHSDDSSSERVEVERILSSRRIVGPSFLAATSSVSLIIFFLSALMFFLFPRIGLGILFKNARSRMSFAGFSDGVTLGGHGLIRNDDTVVMRVKVANPRFQGALAPELHWRGVAFEHYAHGQWSRSANAWATRARREATANITRITLDATNRIPDWPLRGLRQDIYLEPLDTSTLFAASAPLAFELDNVLPGPTGMALYGKLGQNDEVRYEHSAGLHYAAVSSLDPAPDEEIDAAPESDRRVWVRYLEIPPEMPARVAELGRTLTAGKHGVRQKAEAIAAYLHQNYSYTLQMESAPGREPLDYFLFDRKKGHCEYFSSAMAILLRAAGVPTRNVNGFLGGEWNEYGQYIAVRGGDAHSWVEAYVEGVGWVTFDPTPPATSLSLSRGGGGLLDKLRRMLDNLRLTWFKWIIDYDLNSQLSVLKRIGSVLKIGGSVSTKAVSAWIRENKKPLLGTLAFVCVVVPVVTLIRRRRSGSAGGLRPRPRPDHPVVAIYTRAARVLARRGHRRPPAQTPREHAAALHAAAVAGATAFEKLTELYYIARWSDSAQLVAGVDLAAAERYLDEIRQAERVARLARRAAAA